MSTSGWRATRFCLAQIFLLCYIVVWPLFRCHMSMRADRALRNFRPRRSELCSKRCYTIFRSSTFASSTLVERIFTRRRNCHRGTFLRIRLTILCKPSAETCVRLFRLAFLLFSTAFFYSSLFDACIPAEQCLGKSSCI